MIRAPIRILIVEDDLAVARVIKSMLVDAGLEVIDIVTCYEDAMAVLHDSPVNLVLIDIKLPGTKNGIDLANKINTTFEDLPFIYITEYDVNQKSKILGPTGPKMMFTKGEAFEFTFSQSILPNILLQSFRLSAPPISVIPIEELPLNRIRKKARQTVAFLYEKIVSIESYNQVARNCVVIRDVNNNLYLLRGKLEESERKLALPRTFVRISQSCILNTNKITYLRFPNMYVNSMEFTVTDGYKNDTIEFLKRVRKL
jgi:CheY-like chemotaxis protein